MAVHYLNSDYGLLTYYNDTTMYNALVSLLNSTSSVKTLWQEWNGGYTADGNTFFNIIDVDEIYGSFLHPSDLSPTTELINHLNSFFPKIRYVEATDGVEKTFDNNTGRSVITRNNVANTDLKDGTYTIPTRASNYEQGTIYGGGAVYSSSVSHGLDIGSFTIIVFDDDYNNVYIAKPIFYAYPSQRYPEYGGYARYIQLIRGIVDNSYLTAFKNFFKNAEPFIPPVEPTDPYDPSGTGAGYSAGGGGYNPDGDGSTGTGGLHDDTSDPIPTPSLPSDGTISSGLFTAYNPSASQLASFASALWNMQPTDINDVLRFLFGGDAFNAIIGLHLLPVAPSTGGSPSIKLGNWDTGVSAPKITSQYKQVPFGSVLLPEYWGNCIDYAPYTKIQLALPYIGIVDVDTDDVLGSTNTLTYNIDVLSGAICATLHCVKFNLSSVIYQWSGACAVSLPFSGASYNSVVGAIAGVAAAGMGFAAMAAGPIGAALPAAALAAGGGAFGAGSAASILGTMKGKVQKSGSFGANSGALGIMTPYFILTRPVQSVPATWQADKGYPANISAQLGTLTGYTEVSEINLECSGTEAEKKEIIDLLKKGVLF